jgi:biotin carboxylase
MVTSGEREVPRLSERPALLILCGGQREYREYMLERLAGRYQPVLLSPWPVTWERAHIADHEVIDPADTGQIFAAAERMAARYPIAGVLTYYEPCVELASAIGLHLGVPNCPVEGARRCRDKYATREALQKGDVPSARFALVASEEEARHAASRIGYPVIVKPRSLSASFGVSLVGGPDELDAALACAKSNSLTEPWDHQRGIVVEEYLDGPEISVDVVVFRGGVRPVLFAKKILGFFPNFEEIGHVVAAPELIVDDPKGVHEILAAAHRAMGIDNAVTHTEIRMTASGPRIIEINGRSGGDLIPQLGELALGVDIAMASGDVAAGTEPDLAITRGGVAGVRFFYPDCAGRVASVGLDPGFSRPEWLHQVTWLLAPGSSVSGEAGRLYLDRYGFAVVTGADIDDCVTHMKTIDQHARLEFDPVQQ